MSKNICHFIPSRNDYHSLHTVNFVLEADNVQKSELKPCSFYRVYYVKSGTGKLITREKTYPLKKDDVFVVVPDFTHRIEPENDFSYIYISFLGSRASMILDKLRITSSNFFFENCTDMCRFCEHGIEIAGDNSDWIAESVLLYTFSGLARIISPSGNDSKRKNNISLIIKKYIDENFSDSSLSLKKISKEICYSPKYVSGVFKKEFKIGINEYINVSRIQHARNLMQQGFTSVTDISAQCGFSDPQYFSRVFRRRMDVSPKGYIKLLWM